VGKCHMLWQSPAGGRRACFAPLALLTPRGDAPNRLVAPRSANVQALSRPFMSPCGWRGK